VPYLVTTGVPISFRPRQTLSVIRADSIQFDLYPACLK
jgi:hypothetical protein